MSIADNLERIRTRIHDACARAGRNPESVTLIAVSKTHPADAVLEALAHGVQHFGENRVEEAESKIPLVKAQHSEPLYWHMIGHLQSRKAKDAAALFGVVHSIDTVKLAEKLSRQAVDQGYTLDIFAEVNVSGEESKYGFQAAGWERQQETREQFLEALNTLARLPGLRLRGLMTMAPIVDDMEAARPVFASLSALRQHVQETIGLTLPDLSMGMTDDYPIAIEEGATLVRIGRAIFGERLKG